MQEGYTVRDKKFWSLVVGLGMASAYIFAGVGAIIWFIVIVALPRSRNFIASATSFNEDVKAFCIHSKNQKLITMFGFGMVLQMTFTMMWTYIPFHLQHQYELSLQQISLIYITYGFGVVGVIITMLAFLSAVVIGMSFICLGFFIAHALTASSVAEQATHHKGSASSLYLVSYYIGVAIGSTVFSPLYEAYGWHAITLIACILPLVYSPLLYTTKYRLA